MSVSEDHRNKTKWEKRIETAAIHLQYWCSKNLSAHNLDTTLLCRLHIHHRTPPHFYQHSILKHLFFSPNCNKGKTSIFNKNKKQQQMLQNLC